MVAAAIASPDVNIVATSETTLDVHSKVADFPMPLIRGLVHVALSSII
jgi:hypothetical protein